MAMNKRAGSSVNTARTVLNLTMMVLPASLTIVMSATTPSAMSGDREWCMLEAFVM